MPTSEYFKGLQSEFQVLETFKFSKYSFTAFSLSLSFIIFNQFNERELLEVG